MNSVNNSKKLTQSKPDSNASNSKVSNRMKTYSAKPAEVIRNWYVVDASKLPLGRLSTLVANLLTGKNKPMYTSHIDCGDFVIVVNARDLVVTGNKLTGKTYYRHTGYPGGLRESSLKFEIEKNPSGVVEHSIKGMLPVNKLRAGRLARLKIYDGPEHEHAAQKPQIINLEEKK